MQLTNSANRYGAVRGAHTGTEIHEIAAIGLVIVAIFHAVAALVDHFVFRDNPLVRMLPRGKE